MASTKGTVQKTAAEFMRMAGMSRSATGGNKNVKSSASSKAGGVPMNVVAPIKGPDKGNG